MHTERQKTVPCPLARIWTHRGLMAVRSRYLKCWASIMTILARVYSSISAQETQVVSLHGEYDNCTIRGTLFSHGFLHESISHGFNEVPCESQHCLQHAA